MEMTQIFFDTNALSLYLKQDLNILSEVEKADIIYISVITVGELNYGFLKGSLFEQNNLLLNRFLDNPLVRLMGIGKNTAIIYGGIYSYLGKKGIPIPTNDVWVASCVIETDSTLITYDKHFLNIPNLKLWKNVGK